MIRCKYCTKPVIKAQAPYICGYSMGQMTNEEKLKAQTYNKTQAGKPMGYYIHEEFIGSTCDHIMLKKKEIESGPIV